MLYEKIGDEYQEKRDIKNVIQSYTVIPWDTSPLTYTYSSEEGT